MQAVCSTSATLCGGANRRQQQRRATQECRLGQQALCRPLRADTVPAGKLARRAGRLHALRTGCEGLPPLDRAALPPPPPVPVAGTPSLLQRLARIGGAALLGAALVLGPAGVADAARSGGRMGGRSFGGSRFSSSGGFGGRSSGFGAASSWSGSSRLSSSFGSGSKSSYSGGAFTGGFGGWSPWTTSSSSSASSYSSSYKGGALTSGLTSSPPSTTTTGSTGSVRANSFFLSPWGEDCSHLDFLSAAQPAGLWPGMGCGKRRERDERVAGALLDSWCACLRLVYARRAA